ncbi:uncharacterized protein [Clytia hemisphaerica]|uniref:uncharacterized protein n=1 Tax=Clytia hemisphaerica TaxID=252671 RepID=UPI0034D78680
MNFLMILTILFGIIASSVGEPYWLHGLFSMTSCQSQYEFSCSNAVRHERIIREKIKQNDQILNAPMPFCSMDVGGDQPRKLLDAALPLVTQNYITLTGKCIDNNIKGTRNLDGIVVLSLLTFELTQLLSAILLPRDIPLFALTFQPIYPGSLLEHPYFVYSYEASFGRNLHQNGINAFRKELNITVAAVLNIQDTPGKLSQNRQCHTDDASAFCTYYHMVYKNKGCLKETSVDINNDQEIKHTIELILKQPRLSFIVLYGSNRNLRKFNVRKEHMKTKAWDRLYFLNYEVLDLSTNKSYSEDIRVANNTGHGRDIKALLIDDYLNVFYDIPGALAMNNLLYFTHDFKRNFYQKSFMERILQDNDINKLFPPGHFLSTIIPVGFNVSDWVGLSDFVKDLVFNSLRFDKRVIKAQISAWRNTFYVNLVELKELFRHKEYDPGNALKAKPFCHLTKPKCSLGAELKHSFYKEKGWDTSYGWYCETCHELYFRNENQTSCRKCPQGEMSDRSRTYCFDPYTKLYLQFNTRSPATLVIVSLSGLLLLIVIFTLIMYLRKRDTPIVMASSSHVTLCQILAHAVLTVSSVCVFIGYPNYVKCISRPIVVGVLFTLITSINLGKTHKVLLIFKAKLRMSKREIQKARASTVITIMLAFLVDISLLIAIILFDDPPRKEITTYPKSLSQEFHCSNNEDVLIQLGFIFIIDILNVIQGIRSRHVPSHYRETSHVTYSSFTSSVILIAGFAVYQTQLSEHTKTVTMLVIILALNYVHFILIYTYKLYIMIFKAHQNTRHAFEMKRKQRFKRSLEIHVRESARRLSRSRSRTESELSAIRLTAFAATRSDTFESFK